jgi:hypothetical protein
VATIPTFKCQLSSIHFEECASHSRLKIKVAEALVVKNTVDLDRAVDSVDNHLERNLGQSGFCCARALILQACPKLLNVSTVQPSEPANRRG